MQTKRVAALGARDAQGICNGQRESSSRSAAGAEVFVLGDVILWFYDSVSGDEGFWKPESGDGAAAEGFEGNTMQVGWKEALEGLKEMFSHS